MAPNAHLANTRKNEVEVLKHLFTRGLIKGQAKILEVGCGNAISSSFLSADSFVVCTDLPDESRVHNRASLEKIKLGIGDSQSGRIKFLGCSGLEMPFKDGVFDIVFSQYVLEHIKARGRAIQEFKRVLKNGGLIISIVPNFVERFYEFPRYYIYLIKRLGRLFLKKLCARPGSQRLSETDSGKVGFANFLQYYPHFPFIEPHGEYKNAVQEFVSHLPHNWIRLFRDNSLEIVDAFSTNYLPWNLTDVFSYRLTDILYAASRGLTQKIGNKKVIKYLGYSFCIIALKSE